MGKAMEPVLITGLSYHRIELPLSVAVLNDPKITCVTLELGE
jgi:hypothetical protein